MESFGELDPSNQTGISAKSCRLKSAADNPFKNTSAEVPLYIDCLCIPDVIPALHDNHVGSTCSCLNQKPNEIDWIFSVFSISKCIFFLPPHFDLHPVVVFDQWSQSMGFREVLSGGNYQGRTGDFPWSQISFTFLHSNHTDNTCKNQWGLSAFP